MKNRFDYLPAHKKPQIFGNMLANYLQSPDLTTLITATTSTKISHWFEYISRHQKAVKALEQKIGLPFPIVRLYKNNNNNNSNYQNNSILWFLKHQVLAKKGFASSN